MDKETLLLKIAKLIQRSRKAVRIYSSMIKGGNVVQEKYAEVQASQWRDVNNTLLKKLSLIYEQKKTSTLARDFHFLCEGFVDEWRTYQTNLHKLQKELIALSEVGDFVKAGSLVNQLISMKAKIQALEAVCHELQSARGSFKNPKQTAPDDEHSHKLLKEPKGKLIPIVRQFKVR